MKAFNAIYKHGYIYDATTNKRILLREGSEISITVEPTDIQMNDSFNHPNPVLSTQHKIDKMKEKRFETFKIIKKAGEKLYFEIKTKSKEKGSKTENYLFELTLEEDLFCGRKTGKIKHELVECKGVVSQCLSNNLPFFEPIYANSLSDAYMKTFDFYFRLYGKPTANVKEKMMEKPGGNQNFLKSYLLKLDQIE